MPISRERKQQYFARLVSYLDEYNKIFIVQADHVSSLQFAQIRKALRNEAQVLMGKNTMMRKVLTQYVRDHPGHPYELLIPKIKGNMGFIFTNKDLGGVRTIVQNCDVPAPARAGVIAPVNVKVPPGPTGCDPGQTAWFQALNVPTKISRGQIEIVSEMSLIAQGEKVGPSQAALLQKLNIKPFTYGLAISHVYDNGSLFDAAVLDLTDDDLIRKFITGMNHVAAVSLETSCGPPRVRSSPQPSVARDSTRTTASEHAPAASMGSGSGLKRMLRTRAPFAAPYHALAPWPGWRRARRRRSPTSCC